MQQSKFLESNTKFSFNNHRATKQNDENKFASWSNNNFYRTSTNDMSAKVCVHSLLTRLLSNELDTNLFVFLLILIEPSTSCRSRHSRLRWLRAKGKGEQLVFGQAYD